MPEDRNVFLPISPWVCYKCLQVASALTGTVCHLYQEFWKKNTENRGKIQKFFVRCPLLLLVLPLIMLWNLYARIEKNVDVDFLEIPLFIPRTTVDRYGKDQWIISLLPFKYRAVPYGTLSSVFKYVYIYEHFLPPLNKFFLFFPPSQKTTKLRNVTLYTGTQ